jgi:hypothetical protein
MELVAPDAPLHWAAPKQKTDRQARRQASENSRTVSMAWLIAATETGWVGENKNEYAETTTDRQARTAERQEPNGLAGVV